MPWADEAEQQLSRLANSGCELSVDVSIVGAALPEAPCTDPQKLRLKFEVARQASSPSLCASVRAVPWADEAEQQLSKLSISSCELPADVRIVGAGLTKAPSTDTQIYV